MNEFGEWPAFWSSHASGPIEKACIELTDHACSLATRGYYDAVTEVRRAREDLVKEADRAALTVARLVAERDTLRIQFEIAHGSSIRWHERALSFKAERDEAIRQRDKALRKKPRLEDGPEYRWAVLDSERAFWLEGSDREGFFFNAEKDERYLRATFPTKADAERALAERNRRAGDFEERGILVRFRVKEGSKR